MLQSKKRFFFTIISFLYCKIFFGQSSNGSNTILLKTHLLAPIDLFSFPTIQFSLEKRWKNQFSLAGEVGYQFYDLRSKCLNAKDSMLVHPSGFKVNLEVRRYHLIPEISKNTYLALNFYYRRNNYNACYHYFMNNDPKEHIDFFEVERQQWGIDLTLGLQPVLLKKFVLDMYLGFGIKNRIVKNFNREYNYSPYDNIPTDNVLFPDRHFSESSGRRFNLSMGIRLGFQFN
jgi:hypothetical protein